MFQVQLKTPSLIITPTKFQFQTNVSTFVENAELCKFFVTFTPRSICKWLLTSIPADHMNATAKGLMLLNFKNIYCSMGEKKHLMYFQTMTQNDPWMTFELKTSWQSYTPHNTWIIVPKFCKQPMCNVQEIAYFVQMFNRLTGSAQAPCLK